MQFAALGIIALLVQFITEQLKRFIPDGKLSDSVYQLVIVIISTVVALIVAITAKIDLFAMVGITMNPSIVAYALTGIACSAGAVPINEIIKLLTELRPSNQE